MTKIHICVVGGGVIGLSTAVNIIEKICDVKVDIIAEKFSPNTTSDVAGGWWEPHDILGTANKETHKLAEITFNCMRQLCASEHAEEIGAFKLSGFSMFKNEMDPEMLAIKYMDGFRKMTKAELSNFHGFGYGYAFMSFILEGIKYLPWLTKRFVEKGGKLIKKKIHSLNELAGTYDVVVNCTGLGSHDLVHDTQVTPGRGQMIRVSAPWIKHFLADDSNFFYILPRSDHVLLGGSYDEGNYDTTPSSDTRERILEGCAKLEPSLKYAKIEGDLVGLRPCRPKVRLESEQIQTPHKKLQVVHNYGHSGSGVTLHWGSALKATSLVQDAVHRIENQSKL